MNNLPVIRDKDEHGLKGKGTSPIKAKVELGKPAELRSGVSPLSVNDVNDNAVQVLGDVGFGLINELLNHQIMMLR